MWWKRSVLGRALAVVALASGLVGYAGHGAAAAPKAAIVIDTKSGEVLFAEEPDAPRYPASLTKMMTLYLLFGAVGNRQASLGTKISVSEHCSAQPPSRLGLKPGETIKVSDAILALVVQSANDVACAVGEHIGGSEAAFAEQMTAKARRLGMTRTVFRNASGLPDPAQVTTARDMAILGQALQDDFPRSFNYFKTKTFSWGGKSYSNHNRLLGRVEGVDGIKTGYTNASGYNLVCSAKRGRREVIAVVLGGSTGAARDARVAALLDEYMPPARKGFRLFGRQ